MRIPCPCCGPRKHEEFTYDGDATVRRPSATAPDAEAAFYDYVYVRNNPFGPHHELWFHQGGCHEWLVVERDTRNARHQGRRRRTREPSPPGDAAVSSRLAAGRRDRSAADVCRFTFDGKSYTGCAGDSLASALLANGVHLVGRSFKYHRPRGMLSAGPEEPNALVELRSGARREPNTRATSIELYDGLDATSQNRWPSLHFDVRRSTACSRRCSWPASITRRSCGRLVLGEGVRAADPSGRGPGTRGARSRPGPLREKLGALRRAGDRRRSAGLAAALRPRAAVRASSLPMKISGLADAASRNGARSTAAGGRLGRAGDRGTALNAGSAVAAAHDGLRRLR